MIDIFDSALSNLFLAIAIIGFASLLIGLCLAAVSRRKTPRSIIGWILSGIGGAALICAIVFTTLSQSFLDIVKSQLVHTEEVLIIRTESVVNIDMDESWHKSGAYLVGEDIAAGEYYLEAQNSECSIQIKNGKYSSDSRYASNNNSLFFTVKNGEYIDVSSGRFIAAAYAPQREPDADGVYPPGTYRVGLDLPAGEYYINTSSSYASIKVMSSSSLDYDDTRIYRSVNRFSYIAVEESEYLSISDASFCPVENAKKPVFSSPYKAGMYLVGTDIPAGVYYIEVNDSSCYYEVLSDAHAENCLFNDYFETFQYVELKEGEYFSLERGTMVPAKDAPKPEPVNGKYSAGCYLVGQDIPAGTYTLTAASGSAVAYLWNHPRGSASENMNSHYFRGSCDIVVAEGQYLSVSDATFQKKNK